MLNRNSQNEPGMSAGINAGWRIHGGVCHVCVRLAVASRWPSRGSHTSQETRCMRYPSGGGLSGTKPECVLESMASQSTLPSRIEELNGAHVALFAMCAFGGLSWLAHIARDAMYAPPGATQGRP